MPAVRLMPLGTALVVGGADGAIHEADIRAGRTEPMKQMSLWFEALAFGGGILLDLMRFNPDISEPLAIGGLFALSQRLGIMLMRQAQPPAHTGPFRLENFAQPSMTSNPHSWAAPALVQYESRPAILG